MKLPGHVPKPPGALERESEGGHAARRLQEFVEQRFPGKQTPGITPGQEERDSSGGEQEKVKQPAAKRRKKAGQSKRRRAKGR